MKAVKVVLSIAAALIALVGIFGVTLFVLGLLVGVWVPDLLGPPEWIHIDVAVMPDGQELHLLQKCHGNFYGTFIMARDEGKWERAFLVGVDDSRIWGWKLYLHPSEGLATLDVSRGRVFRYTWATRELRGSQRSEPYGPWFESDFQDSVFGPLPKPSELR